MLAYRLGVAAIASMAIALTTAAWVHADEASRTQYLTFSRSVELPGVTLRSGTYIFELPDSSAAPDIVRVTSGDRKTVFLTVYTRSVDRPASVPPTELVSFREAAPNQPLPITVWWSDGGRGREFIYR
jgi:hypothetical protein